MPCKCGLIYHDDGRCQTIGDRVRLMADPAYSPRVASLEAAYRADKDASGPYQVTLRGVVLTTGTLGECHAFRNRMERESRRDFPYNIRRLE